MGIRPKLGNGDWKEWKLNAWEREGMGILKCIPFISTPETGERVFYTVSFTSIIKDIYVT